MADVVQTVQIAVRVPASLRDRAERLAEADDRNLSYVVRQALTQWVDDNEATEDAA